MRSPPRAWLIALWATLGSAPALAQVEGQEAAPAPSERPPTAEPASPEALEEGPEGPEGLAAPGAASPAASEAPDPSVPDGTTAPESPAEAAGEAVSTFQVPAPLAPAPPAAPPPAPEPAAAGASPPAAPLAEAGPRAAPAHPDRVARHLPPGAKVAVFGFVGRNGASPAEVRAAADVVAATLRRLADVEVITESDLESVLGLEAARAAMGCDTESCLSELGQSLGCDLLVSGTVMWLDDGYLLTLTLIEMEKLRAVNAVTRRLPPRQGLLVEVAPDATAELVGVEAAQVRSGLVRVEVDDGIAWRYTLLLVPAATAALTITAAAGWGAAAWLASQQASLLDEEVRGTAGWSSQRAVAGQVAIGADLLLAGTVLLGALTVAAGGGVGGLLIGLAGDDDDRPPAYRGDTERVE